jgi:hypothetical protein
VEYSLETQSNLAWLSLDDGGNVVGSAHDRQVGFEIVDSRCLIEKEGQCRNMLTLGALLLKPSAAGS